VDNRHLRKGGTDDGVKGVTNTNALVNVFAERVLEDLRPQARSFGSSESR
jgi:hypothetical protein